MPNTWRDLDKQNVADYQGLRGRTGKAAEAGTSGYLKGAMSFDPSQAVSQYGQGFLDQAQEGLGRDFESLAGSSVGSGRLKSGFFQRGQQDLFQDFNRRVANAVAMQSMNAANLDLQNIQGMGRFGLDMQDQQVELLTGAMDRSQAEENADEGGWFSRIVGGGLGAVAGSVLPGFGTAAGAALGGKVAGWINGGD